MRRLLSAAFGSASALAAAICGALAQQPRSIPDLSRHDVRTIPWRSDFVLRTATYTPSGKVLVVYSKTQAEGRRDVNIATMDDDGRNLRPFFSSQLPDRPKDNGVRYMVFPDNRRIFLGDFVVECSTSLETCADAKLLPVRYPAEIADGDHISHRWSEMIVAPDNRHIAWTTLTANYSALVFTGVMRRETAGYVIAEPRIVSTVDPFTPDPKHADGVRPQVYRGGEVKQFVVGGTALSLAGGNRRDIADSVVHHLASGRMEVVTQTPGYDETTIFSPDGRLGLVMTARFSPASDVAILGLLPRPFPDSLNMGLNMLVYTHAVVGVRAHRPGNIGPALIEIAASEARPDYVGTNLSTSPDWVFSSPMSWHPSSTRAMWIERSRQGDRDDRATRIQVVSLPNYRAASPIPTRPTPDTISYSITDLSVVRPFAAKSGDVDVKVYGRRSGYLTFKRTSQGSIEKIYHDFSDDASGTYSGSETMRLNPRGRSTYTADVRLAGPRPGAMRLSMTFGPIGGDRPAEIIFDKDAAGRPLSSGYAEYGGRRLQVADLVP